MSSTRSIAGKQSTINQLQSAARLIRNNVAMVQRLIQSLSLLKPASKCDRVPLSLLINMVMMRAYLRAIVYRSTRRASPDLIKARDDGIVQLDLCKKSKDLVEFRNPIRAISTSVKRAAICTAPLYSRVVSRAQNLVRYFPFLGQRAKGSRRSPWLV